MNDQKLKDLLKSDHSEPLAPQTEWNQILLKIEKQGDKKNFLFYLKPLLLCSIVGVILFSTTTFKNQRQTHSDEISAYLFEDNYLDEEDDLYVWIDTLD